MGTVYDLDLFMRVQFAIKTLLSGKCCECVCVCNERKIAHAVYECKTFNSYILYDQKRVNKSCAIFSQFDYFVICCSSHTYFIRILFAFFLESTFYQSFSSSSSYSFFPLDSSFEFSAFPMWISPFRWWLRLLWLFPVKNRQNHDSFKW